MKHLSLFSGIGGFDLAAEWMGWENVAHCELNPFGRKILNYYWPNAISYEDITKTDFNVHRGTIDVLTGGFPCQPYSVAGLRKGKEDERHLWPEMLRAIREIKPRWIVGENVLGLVSWNGGLVFEEVQADLEAEGYEVQPYVLPAAGVNAPHKRYRIWFVAYRDYGNGAEIGFQTGRKEHLDRDDGNGDSPHSNVQRCGECDTSRVSEKKGWNSGSINEGRFFIGDWEVFPTQPPVSSGNDGLSSQLDGITFPKWRNESIMAGGNAVVPQVVYQIFKAIKKYELTNPTLQDKLG